MANEKRIRADYVLGKIDVALDTVATTLSSPRLARLPVIDSTSHAAVTLTDPATGNYEICHVTAHASGATTATIARAREGSTAQSWPIDTAWANAPTVVDFAVPVLSFRKVTAATTAANREFLKASSWGGFFVITLPVPTAGARVIVHKTDTSTNAINVKTHSTTTFINFDDSGGGGNTDTHTGPTARGQSIEYTTDGTHWYTVKSS